MRRAVLGTLVLVVVVLGSMAAGLRWWLERNGPAPELLIQRRDSNFWLLAPGGQSRPLTTDADGTRRRYAYPVPAPDGRSVAYVEALHAGQAVTSSLIVHRLYGDRRTLFTRQDSQPFYLYWSPDSSQLAFLASDATAGMMLRTVNVLGSPAAQQVTPGSPSYFAWAPDGKRLLLHTGGSAPQGSLGLWQLGDAEPRRLQGAPGIFQAPVWLQDGRSAVAVIADQAQVVLARIDETGTIRQRLAETQAGMIFVLSPSRKQIAYLPLSPGEVGNLRIVGIDGGNDREVAGTSSLSFWWSPDSTKLAYLTTSQDEDETTTIAQGQPRLMLTWHVLDVQRNTSRALHRFAPSPTFASLLPYFDQYAQSIQLWDNQSRRLVFADPEGVWTLDVETGATVKVEDGVLGLWINP